MNNTRFAWSLLCVSAFAVASPVFAQSTDGPVIMRVANAQQTTTENSAAGVYQPSVSSSACCSSPAEWGGQCCDAGPNAGGYGPAGNRFLFGRPLFQASDHGFDCFISPMTNPVFFEDPRNLTEARFIYLNHQVPTAAGGGHVQLYALQLRARLSENVSLIATKDGYITSTNPLINDGWADLSAGLKFNLLRNVNCQRLLSGGFTFEVPTGEADPLQGNGDGELNLFLSYGQSVGSRAHWISAGGFRVPFNSTDESMSSYWSNHLDVQIRPGIYWLLEGNWYHWLQSGTDGPIPGIEGLDLFNLGSPGVAGNDIVTAATGLKFKPNRNNELGVAVEFPITERRDIIENRFTFDWIIRY
jgi:hypothetical protein